MHRENKSKPQTSNYIKLSDGELNKYYVQDSCTVLALTLLITLTLTLYHVLHNVRD